MRRKPLLELLPEPVRALARKRAPPAWLEPMLATLTREVFSAPDWIFETKLDGVRCLAYKHGDSVKLFSRNRLALNAAYPELLKPLQSQKAQSFILDGEVVALEKGISRFTKLQRRRFAPTPIFYYVFDILFCDGYDVTRLPLLERKRLLRRAVSLRDPLRLSEHREAEGEKYYREACAKGWEGLIGKRADSPYVHRRSPDWLKFKCENQQGITSTPFLSAPAAAALIGRELSPDVIRAAASAARLESRPLDNTDLDFSWRRSMVEVWVRRTLEDLQARMNAQKGSA